MVEQAHCRQHARAHHDCRISKFLSFSFYKLMGLQRALDCTWSGRLSSVGRNDRTLFPFAEYLQSSHICRMLPGPKETLIYDQRYAKGDSPARCAKICTLRHGVCTIFVLSARVILCAVWHLVAVAGYGVLVLHAFVRGHVVSGWTSVMLILLLWVAPTFGYFRSRHISVPTGV